MNTRLKDHIWRFFIWIDAFDRCSTFAGGEKHDPDAMLHQPHHPAAVLTCPSRSDATSTEPLTSVMRRAS